MFNSCFAFGIYLWWLNYMLHSIKYKYDEFWINVHLGKISEIHDCMFCSENSKVQFALHFAASISLIFLLNKVQVLHVSKISVTAIILLNKLKIWSNTIYTFNALRISKHFILHFLNIFTCPVYERKMFVTLLNDKRSNTCTRVFL